MINFSAAERRLIARLSVADGWDHDDAEDLKRKIKDHFLENGVPCCCYCGLSVGAWHRISIDTEHILPKQRFPQYTFDIRNLNISCKRCNMEIKGVDVSFFLGSLDEADPFRSELYSFVHPNLDQPATDHLILLNVQVGTKQLITYVKQTPKGQFTYEYFDLKEIETNSFSNAQGLAVATPSEDFPPEVARELRAVLKAIEGA